MINNQYMHQQSSTSINNHQQSCKNKTLIRNYMQRKIADEKLVQSAVFPPGAEIFTFEAEVYAWGAKVYVWGAEKSERLAAHCSSVSGGNYCAWGGKTCVFYTKTPKNPIFHVINPKWVCIQVQQTYLNTKGRFISPIYHFYYEKVRIYHFYSKHSRTQSSWV